MYNNLYDNPLIRNGDYNIQNYILQYYKKDYCCLDLGCGNCRKIKELCDIVDYYYAVDMNANRIEAARTECAGIRNVILGTADNFYLPFENSYFDLVSCFMSRYSVGETARVLKSGGLFIVETAGANDKRAVREAFGKDTLGWRGRMLADTSKDRLSRLIKELSPFFEVKNTQVIRLRTKMPSNLFIELLHMTNEIRDFNEDLDKGVIKELEDEDKNIGFDEEKFIIVAKRLNH